MKCLRMLVTAPYLPTNVLPVKQFRLVACLLLGFLLCFLLYSMNSTGNHFQPSLEQFPSDTQNKEDETWNHEVIKRIEDAQALCFNLETPVRLFRTSLHNLLWSPESHLAYCRHGKVGTTTLIKLFYDFINKEFPDELTAHINAPKLFGLPRNVIYRAGDYFKFTVVRHPMTRLVSAYKEKTSVKYHRSLLKSIRDRYRPSTKNLTEWIKIGELAEIDMTEMPTFREFAMFVVQDIQNFVHKFFSHDAKRQIDVHWRPFYMRCNPCTLDFDGIVKMETFERDMKYVTRRVSHLMSKEIDPSNDPVRNSILTSKRNDILEVLRSFKGTVMNTSKGLSTTELTRKILALLPKDENLMLKKAFSLDFLLFGYHPNEYG